MAIRTYNLTLLAFLASLSVSFNSFAQLSEFTHYPVGSSISTIHEASHLNISTSEPIEPFSQVASDPTVYKCPNNASYSVHLTFDDGPQIPETPQILDELKKRNIKATFFFLTDHFPSFLNGTVAKTKHEKDLLKVLNRIKREGHVLGSHSFHHIPHANLDLESEKSVQQNLERNLQVLKNLGFKPPMPFRFPYGSGWFQDKNSQNQSMANYVFDSVVKSGFEPVHWDIDSWDWSIYKNPKMPLSLLKQICAHGGGISLMHDVQKNTAANIGVWIDSILASGHKIVSLEEIKTYTNPLFLQRRLQSLKRETVGISVCDGKVSDLDQVWPDCASYHQHNQP